MKVPVVILAGGVAKPDLQAVIGVSVRALAVVNGRTLLDHVLEGVENAPDCGDVVVTGNVPASGRYTQIPDGGDMVTNIFAGLDRFAEAEYVLISTSDLPFLTGESVQDFVQKAIALAESTGAHMIYPIVPVDACYRRFPGVKRTARKLREGNFTGGNLVLVRPGFMKRQQTVISDAYAARKSPARLAAMLGYGTLVRLVLSQLFAPNLLSVSFLEDRVSHLLGGSVKALESSYPEIATDFDKPADFTTAN